MSDDVASQPPAEGDDPQGAHEPPGPSGLRQPEPAHGRRARPRRRWRTTSSSRRSATSTASGSPSASCMRAGTAAFGYFEAYGTVGDEPIAQYTRAKLFQQQGKRTDVAVRFSTVAGGRDSSEAGSRPARLRGQVLHRGRQLGAGRQQPRRLLHPRRDQVPGLHPLAQARPGHLRAPGAQPRLRLLVSRPPRRCT